MAISYIQQNLRIDIYISKDDIDSTDTVNLYETTVDPSAPVLLSTLNSTEVEVDPSSTGDAYLFSYIKAITTSDTYSFEYTVLDSCGNESSVVNTFESEICLVPAAPDAIDFDELDFSGDDSTSTAVDLDANTVAHYKMNDNATSDVVVDSQGTSNGTYKTANTNTKSVVGKINTALSFDGVDNHIDTNATYSTTFANSFSINFWSKLTDGDDDSGDSYSLFGATDFGAASVTCFANNGVLYFRYGVTTPHHTISTVSKVFSTGQEDWHMITCTVEEVDTNNIRMEMYLDNVLVAESGIQSMDMDSFTTVGGLFINSNSGAFATPNNPAGVIDDFRIIDRLLTTEERNFLYNGTTGTEDDTLDEYYTIYHSPDGDPSTLVEDGEFSTTAEIYGVDTPSPDGLYNYFRTATSVDCDIESANSDDLLVTIDTTNPSLGEAFQYPLSDPYNLYLDCRANGTFQLLFNYDIANNDPVDAFNIYYNIIENPSNPSADVEIWILDGTISTLPTVFNRYGYNTVVEHADGEYVEYKAVPSADGSEKDNDVTITGTADDQAPVVVTDYVVVTLE